MLHLKSPGMRNSLLVLLWLMCFVADYFAAWVLASHPAIHTGVCAHLYLFLKHVDMLTSDCQAPSSTQILPIL